MHNSKYQCHLAAWCIYHQLTSSCCPGAVQKSLSLHEKYWRIFWKKFRRKDQQAEKDRKVTGLVNRTRVEIAKWNQMTTLRFQTGGKTSDILGLPSGSGPHSRAAKKNSSHGNEVLPQDTTHLIQRSTYQRKSMCPDPAGNRTTRRPPGHRKETQTEVVWTCLPFIRSCQNHLARHIKRGTKTRQTEKEMGRQHQRMDRPGVHQVLEGKMEETGCEMTCGAPTTPAVKGYVKEVINTSTSHTRVRYCYVWLVPR